MECKDQNTLKYIVKNSRKYIVMDTDITYSLDFNGWPDEVVILEVEGLKKALGTTCLFFDTGHNLLISDIYTRSLTNKNWIISRMDGWTKKGGMIDGPGTADTTATADRPGTADATCRR